MHPIRSPGIIARLDDADFHGAMVLQNCRNRHGWHTQEVQGAQTAHRGASGTIARLRIHTGHDQKHVEGRWAVGQLGS